MSKYVKALRARRRALRECEQARRELHESVDGILRVYETHPIPILASGAGIGFVLAQLRVGSGLVRTGVHVATGPAWQLVRRYVDFG